jgi:hypothetical protein
VSRFGPPGSAVLETAVDPTSGLVATGVCSPERRAAAIVFNPGAATTVAIGFGDLVVPVEVGASSLTAVRAPEGVACTLVPEPGGALLAMVAGSTLAALERVRQRSG